MCKLFKTKNKKHCDKTIFFNFLAEKHKKTINDK